MSEKRFSWKIEKLQHLDNNEVIMIVDNANKDWKGHILNIVDLLNNLAEENKILIRQKNILDRTLCARECECEKLAEENEQLRKDKERLKERLRECGMRLDRFNCR